jgi:hypothetical protein
MKDESKVELEVKKLREEVSELRNVVNLLLGLIMEEDDVETEEIRAPENSRIYN